MRYERAQEFAGRGVALLVAAALFAYPLLPSAREWAESSGVFAGYLAFVRWGAFTWLIVAFNPWRQLAPKVAWWPGDDSHNLYGLAALLLGISGAGSLIYGLLFPLTLIAALLGKPTWHLATASGLFAAYGVWAIRACRRFQDRAVARDHASAA